MIGRRELRWPPAGQRYLRRRCYRRRRRSGRPWLPSAGLLPAAAGRAAAVDECEVEQHAVVGDHAQEQRGDQRLQLIGRASGRLADLNNASAGIAPPLRPASPPPQLDDRCFSPEYRTRSSLRSSTDVPAFPWLRWIVQVGCSGSTAGSGTERWTSIMITAATIRQMLIIRNDAEFDPVVPSSQPTR